MRSPRTQKPRSQQWPEYPQSSGSTSHTDIQTVPQKHKRNRRPRDLPQTPTCRNVEQKRKTRYQYTGKSPNKKKNQYQKAARMSADPAVCLSEADIPETSKKGKGTLPKKETRAHQSRPKHPQTPGSTSKANIQDSNPAGAAALGGSP